MRWIAKVACLAGLAGILTGCSQQLFVTEGDFKHYQDIMPACLESKTTAGLPDLARKDFRVPVTVLDPEKRDPWYVSLQEAIALSLENGTTGLAQVRAAGQVQDDLLSANQLQNIAASTDSIRVLKLQPGVIGAQIEAALSRFDVNWVTFANWRYVDEQVLQGAAALTNQANGRFETSLTKPLASGGLANITFSTDYTLLAQPTPQAAAQNPAYISRLLFNFEQPLFVGFGTDINELLSRPLGASPGSQLTGPAQSFLGARPATINPPQGSSGFLFNQGIVLTRLRFDQSRADFEARVNYQLLNVETAYWNLYGSYVNMYASETGMRMAHRIWMIRKTEADVGAKPKSEAERAKGQFELFRGDRLAAMNQVLENERVLRRLLGLPVEDGKQLIPIDAPSLAPYHPDFRVALEEALTLRPELIAARDELKAKQMDLTLQKHFLLPDLRFVSQYGASGSGTRLDGNGSIFDATTGQFRSSNALRNLASTNFTDWNIGLVLNVPLGYRYEHAAVRVARLNLAQMWLGLKNEEQKAESFLAKTYRDIDASYELIKIRQSQRVGFSQTLQDYEAKIKAGTLESAQYEALLQSQRDWVNALQTEYQAVVNYNTSVAAFQFAKGTIQQHDNVLVSEGPLPECAVGRASEHEHRRSVALVGRERAQPVRLACGSCGGPPIPELPPYSAPTVAALQEGAKIDGIPISGNGAIPDMTSSRSPYADVSTTAPEAGQGQGMTINRNRPTTQWPTTTLGQLPMSQAPGNLPVAINPAAPVPSAPIQVPAFTSPGLPQSATPATTVAPGEALPDLPQTVVPPATTVPEAQFPTTPVLPSGNAGMLPVPPGGP